MIYFISLISGIVSGLGMGGGTILIILLVLFQNVPQHIAQGTNVIFFIPTAIIACITNYKQKIIDFKNSKTIIIAGIIGAIAGAMITKNIDSTRLKKYFGIFLLILQAYEVFTFIREYIKNKKEKNITEGNLN